MTQLAFDLAPRARRTDPVTSHIAAERAQHFAGSHKDRILSALKQHGPAAPPKLEKLTGLSVVQLDRRLCEMQREGLIRVMQAGGVDLVVGGFRCWEAL